MYRRAAVIMFAVLANAAALAAQDPPSREHAIEEAEQAKSELLTPAKAGKAEAYVARISDTFLSGQMHWHAFWQNAYSGGGFTVGAGYVHHVTPYNWLDVRGSITPSGYKRMEAQFFAPEVWHRRGTFSLLGGWREATQVGFYGLGPASHKDSQVNYGFTQPYFGGTLEVFPARNPFVVRGDLEVSQWNQGASGGGSVPSIESAYTPATLPGLGASPVYLHSQGMIGFDSRPARGYTRRGGFYGMFKSRRAFLDALLDTWEQRSTDDVLARVETEADDTRARVRLAGVLTFSRDLLAVDLAVRDWARRDKAVARRLRRVDDSRMDYLRAQIGAVVTDPDELEARVLLAFTLAIGRHFASRRSEPEVVERALDVILR